MSVSDAMTGETLAYSVRMLWFGILVSADVSITSWLMNGATPAMQQALLIKSAILFGSLMLVMSVEFPSRGNTGETEETA